MSDSDSERPAGSFLTTHTVVLPSLYLLTQQEPTAAFSVSVMLPEVVNLPLPSRSCWEYIKDFYCLKYFPPASVHSGHQTSRRSSSGVRQLLNLPLVSRTPCLRVRSTVSYHLHSLDGGHVATRTAQFFPTLTTSLLSALFRTVQSALPF